jgi:predicted DNA-binding transcriptional regulator YafY
MTTTPATRPPAWTILEQALRQRRAVQLSYHGRRRTVCPHALGWKNNKAMLLAYQNAQPNDTQNHSADPRKKWRNLFVDEIADAAIADPAIEWETADNYNPAHPFNAIDQLAIAITSPPSR